MPKMKAIAERVAQSYATARIGLATRQGKCTICGAVIRRSGLFLRLADYILCSKCARKYGGHRGPWRRGAPFQMFT